MTDNGINETVKQLKAHVAALEQLLAVDEPSVLGQANRLKHALNTLAEVGNELMPQGYKPVADLAQTQAAGQPAMFVGNSPVVLFRWRAAEGWPVEFVSENVVQFGYTPEELLSGEVSYASIVHPDDLERMDHEVAEYSANGPDSFRQEYRLIVKNGEVRWTDNWTEIKRDAEGRITHYQGIVVDITGRKQAEEELREAQEQAQVILEAVTVPMIISRVPDGTILYANDPHSRFFSIPRDELIGQPTRSFFEDPAEREKFVSLLRSQGAVNDYEVRIRKSNGELPWVLVSSRLFNFRGETATITMLIDITERKLAEESLAKRATELEAVAEVSTAASTILEVDKLLQEVVDLTKGRFGLYHTHIYLLNEAEDTLDLAAGADAVGRQMVAEGWSIPLAREQSLVAQAARTRQGVTINDVREDPNFLPNPLLPETHSEMAVPMMVGQQVLGVLDVQAKEINRFSDEDIRILTALATQVAVALQNARQLQQTQAALAEVEATQRRYTLQAWEMYRTRQTMPNYEYVREGVAPLGDELPSEVSQAIAQRQTTVIASPPLLPANGNESRSAAVDELEQVETDTGRQSTLEAIKSSLIVPLTVRHEVIGVLGLQETDEARSWSPEEVALVEAIGEQLAQAAEQLRLFDETQERAARERRTNEIGEKIQAAQSLEEALQVAIKEVGLSLKAPQTMVQLDVE